MRAGLGLRRPYFAAAIAGESRVDFWEVITENVMVAGGNPRRVVRAVRERAPIVLHGVSLSIGSIDPLSRAYLDQLRGLVDELDPWMISDHLCWSGVDGRSGHDLWPVALSVPVLDHVAARVHAVQDRIRRPIALENPAAYARFPDELSEPEFLTELVRRTGCGILLDVANVHVSATNLGWDPIAYLHALPAHAITHVHLAGHTQQGETLIDTHDHAICEPTWELYRIARGLFGDVPTSIERDEHHPPLSELLDELDAIRSIESATRFESVPSRAVTPTASTRTLDDFAAEQRAFYAFVTSDASAPAMIGEPAIYREMYGLRLRDVLRADFPETCATLDDAAIAAYFAAHPPTSFTVRELGRHLPAYLERVMPEHAMRASIELARLDAFDARDEAALTRDELALPANAFVAFPLARSAASTLLPRHLVWRGPRGVVTRELEPAEHAYLALLPCPVHVLADAVGDPAALVALLDRWLTDRLLVGRGLS
ncbi:MAG: DUF692 family protein [Kofleriaceae bacterium]